MVNENDQQTADEATLDEARLILETGVEARVCAVIEPIILDLGYRLVRVRVTGQNGMTLQVMAERADGTFNVSDCEKVSLEISPALDVEDPIARAYHLEISSPGIDRPLVRRSDFSRWLGHTCKLETQKMQNGRKRFKGTMDKLEGNALSLTAEDGETQEIDITDLAEARLVMTDELIREALQKDKALREANQVVEGSVELEAANDEIESS